MSAVTSEPSDALFTIEADEHPVERDPQRYITPDMGHDARRTARRRALIEDGVHPATRLPVTDAGTCGDCAHLTLKRGRWWKCVLTLKRGRGPDMVQAWPSCTAWEARG